MQKTSNGAADNGAALDGGGDVDDSGASERRNKRDLDIVRLQLLNAKMQSDRRSADEDRAVAAHLMTNLPQVPLAGVAGWEQTPFARVLRFFACSAWPSSLLLTAPRPLLPVSHICVGTGAGIGGRRRDAGRRAGDGVGDRRGVHRHGPHPQGA